MRRLRQEAPTSDAKSKTVWCVCVCMKKKGEKRRALPIPFSLPGPLALLMIFKCNRLKVCRLRRFCRWKCRTIASSLLDFDTAVSLFFFLCGIFPKVLTDRTIFTVFPLTISFGSQKEGKEISVHLYVYVWLSGNFDWTNDAVFTLSDSTQTDKEENKLFFSSSSTSFSLIGWNVTERKSLVLWVIFTSFSCIHYMARGGTPLKSVVMA